MNGGGPVAIELHIIFASPEKLDRPRGDRGHLRGFNHKVSRVPSPEAPADQRLMDRDGIGCALQQARDCGARVGGILGRQPGLHSVWSNMYGGVHRLHGCVSQKR